MDQIGKIAPPAGGTGENCLNPQWPNFEKLAWAGLVSGTTAWMRALIERANAE